MRWTRIVHRLPVLGILDSSTKTTMASSLSDALLDGFVGQFYRETDGVRDLLQSLRDGNQELALPQIIVVGQESSGKSSVLESLAMLPLFPRDEDICTRMPIHLKLRREAAPPVSDGSSISERQVTTPTIKMRLVYSDGRKPMEKNVALDEVVPLTHEWMERVVTEASGAVKGIVDHVLEIHVTSPDVPTLDLIDLPGIVAGRLFGEPDDMMEQTRALVEKYLSMPHTLVLAVVPAKERVRNSQAFQLVQQAQLTHRTIGVLTMVDRSGDASDPNGHYAAVMERLDGRAKDIVPLDPHGYVAVISRDARPNAVKLSLAEFKPYERQWLTDNLPGYIERGLASSGVLAVKVAKMLTQHVRESWVPLTLKQLDEKMAKVSKDNDALGKSSATLVDELLNGDRVTRITTLKQLLAPTIRRVSDAADVETTKLVQLLRAKMELSWRERDASDFFSSSASTSDAALMAHREQIRVLLDEHIQAIVMSVLYRLSSLVRIEVTAQKSSPGDAYHTAVFENLFLLAAFTMWPKAEMLLMARERVVYCVVAAMNEDKAVDSRIGSHEDKAVGSRIGSHEDKASGSRGKNGLALRFQDVYDPDSPHYSEDHLAFDPSLLQSHFSSVEDDDLDCPNLTKNRHATANLSPKSEPRDVRGIGETELASLVSTIESVSAMLATESGKRNLPLPLEASEAAKCVPATEMQLVSSSEAPVGASANDEGKSNSKARLESITKNKAPGETTAASTTTTESVAERVNDDTSKRLYDGITRHVVAPLLRELMNAGAMADTAVGYLLRSQTPRESPLHWFRESTAMTRQQGIDTVARLKAAREGVAGLLRLSE